MSEKKYSPEESAELAKGDKNLGSLLRRFLHVSPDTQSLTRGINYGITDRGAKWYTAITNRLDGTTIESTATFYPDGHEVHTTLIRSPDSPKKPA